MYFYDTGLVSSLLGITSAVQIETFYMRGALFENFVVSELLKRRLFAGKSEGLYFYANFVTHWNIIFQKTPKTLHFLFSKLFEIPHQETPFSIQFLS